jgi:glycosyltransferase involved in cell wall biosynthesis
MSQASTRKPIEILAVATQGTGGDDEARLRALLENLPATIQPFDRASKVESFVRLLVSLRRRPKLAVMEGTGVAGGLALLLARRLWGVPYVVSSGDAVAPFVAAHYPVLGPVFAAYERLLCSRAAGYIGWSPYLAGRALTLGAPRAMTAPGWAPFTLSENERIEARREARVALDIHEEAIVFGIVGSLKAVKRIGYSYGQELVRAVGRVDRPDIHVLIVGDGDGREALEEMARAAPGRCHFTGKVSRDRVPAMLAAMDVGSLPQSVDGVGSFRYTTKISEYLAARLPVVTGRIPLAYDLDEGWIWRLDGEAPWNERYVSSLAALMERISREEIAAHVRAIPQASALFDRERQIARTTEFLTDLVGEPPSRSPL